MSPLIEPQPPAAPVSAEMVRSRLSSFQEGVRKARTSSRTGRIKPCRVNTGMIDRGPETATARRRKTLPDIDRGPGNGHDLPWEDPLRYGAQDGPWPEPPGDDPWAEPPAYNSQQDVPLPYGSAYGEPPEEESSLVRMYTVSRGRTAPRTGLAMEALVSSATSEQLGLSYIREYRVISDLCRQIPLRRRDIRPPRHPLGVARVLISDMESEGLVRVHRPQIDGVARGPTSSNASSVVSTASIAPRSAAPPGSACETGWAAGFLPGGHRHRGCPIS